MSEKIWSDDAWADYLYWQTQDKKTLKRINLLIKDIERNGVLSGLGDPEAFKGYLQGEYSRRINHVYFRSSVTICSAEAAPLDSRAITPNRRNMLYR